MRFTIDERFGGYCNEKKIETVSVAVACNQICILDGSVHTLLSLEREDGAVLCVGGDGKWFIIIVSYPDGENFTLVNPEGKDGETKNLCAGGQYADFSTAHLVDNKKAIKVVVSFFEEAEKQLVWV